MVEIHRARSRTRHAIITATHNCRRNFEVVYGFICGRGTQEDSTCYPAFDLVVSVLPIESSCSRDANSVDETYANFIGQLPILSITAGLIQEISPDPPGRGTTIFFRGALHKAVGEYIGEVYYKQKICYLCRFSAGDHGDSGACVFYKNATDRYIAFGILTAKIIDNDYVVTPLSEIVNSRGSTISLLMQVSVLPHATCQAFLYTTYLLLYTSLGRIC